MAEVGAAQALFIVVTPFQTWGIWTGAGLLLIGKYQLTNCILCLTLGLQLTMYWSTGIAILELSKS